MEEMTFKLHPAVQEEQKLAKQGALIQGGHWWEADLGAVNCSSRPFGALFLAQKTSTF